MPKLRSFGPEAPDELLGANRGKFEDELRKLGRIDFELMVFSLERSGLAVEALRAATETAVVTRAIPPSLSKFLLPFRPMKEVQAERSDGTLVLSWGGETTTIDLDEVQEIYVLRLQPDAPTASEDQTVLLVESSTFVGVRAYSPGLLGAIEDRLEELREQGQVFQVHLSGLPWKWSSGLFGVADMKPARRPIAELERMKQKSEWNATVPPPDEELFPL